jgi:hypothetical protein
MWGNVVFFITRVARIPVFSVPLVNPPFDGWDKSGPSPSPGCVTCDKGESSDGGKPLKCSASEIARLLYEMLKWRLENLQEVLGKSGKVSSICGSVSLSGSSRDSGVIAAASPI